MLGNTVFLLSHAALTCFFKVQTILFRVLLRRTIHSMDVQIGMEDHRNIQDAA